MQDRTGSIIKCVLQGVELEGRQERFERKLGLETYYLRLSSVCLTLSEFGTE